jgi:hypothetical protein
MDSKPTRTPFLRAESMNIINDNNINGERQSRGATQFLKMVAVMIAANMQTISPTRKHVGNVCTNFNELGCR